MNKLIDKKRGGIEGLNFDTPGKTNTNAIDGLAERIVTHTYDRRTEKIRCGKCGVAGVKLYPGGKGRLSSMCAECLWPRSEKKSDEGVGTDNVESFPLDVRVIRLIRCFACQKLRPQSAMSAMQVICRDCLTNDGSRQAKLRIEKAILRLGKAVRRAACI